MRHRSPMAADHSSSQEIKLSARFLRLQQQLGQHVRAIRAELGMTLAEAEELSGISTRHWQKIEAGEVNLTLVTLHRVSMALSVDVEELFTARD